MHRLPLPSFSSSPSRCCRRPAVGNEPTSSTTSSPNPVPPFLVVNRSRTRLFRQQPCAISVHFRYFSVIAPGDTINVLGEFDCRGICDVNREKNFLIVHPDNLVSGTRVSSSFNCPRRTVLEERLKYREHSAAVLIGTLLHQIFQAGLIRELPTKEFLEEYARTVLQKSIENLYACGAL